MSVAEFGISRPGLRYIERPGAYAIILDGEGRIAVVRSDLGRFFLPGGGMEVGESPEEALHREVLEECGWAVDIKCRLGAAIQYVEAPGEGNFRIHGTYFRASVRAHVAQPTAVEYKPIWLGRAEASSRLHREADIWAIGLIG